MTNTTTALIRHAKGRSQKVTERLLAAERAIELDIEGNNGVYPLNGGRLTQAEVCRRAGIKQITLQGAAHKTTTKVQVDKWLEQVRGGIALGKKTVRRAVTGRVMDMKRELELIANSYHVAELEMIHLRKTVSEQEQSLKALTDEKLALLEQLNKGKVVRMRRN